MQILSETCFKNVDANMARNRQPKSNLITSQQTKTTLILRLDPITLNGSLDHPWIKGHIDNEGNDAM